MSQGSKNKTKAVAMADLVSSMKQQLDYYWSIGEATDRGMNYSPIFRVQQHIREVDRFSYQPFILSMGPYHHGAASLQSMDKLKWGFLDEVLKLNSKKTLLDYLLVTRELAEEARNCYSEDINMNDEEFLLMLLRDGCFILAALGATRRILPDMQLEEIVVENADMLVELSPDVNNNMQSTGTGAVHDGYQSDRKEENKDGQQDEQIGLWFSRFLHHDLFLLENQIPFFVVKRLYDLASGHLTSPPSLTEVLNKFVGEALAFYPKSVQESNRPEDFQHLLHLCQMYLRPSLKVYSDHEYQVRPHYIFKFLSFGRRYFKIARNPDSTEQFQSVGQEKDPLQTGQELNRWRRAAQYIEAGVKFKKRMYDNVDPHSLLDIIFSNGSIEIPCLVVDEYSGSLFRNIIAFEQTCPRFGDDITAYIVFMSQVISMPEDVTMLVDREIIVHHLDSDRHVSDLFTMLSKDVVFDFNGNYYLKSLCWSMEEHYQNRINRWIAWLWVNHFSNPWLALAALGTGVVLICTVIQTIYTILAYVKPSSDHK